MSSEQSLSRTRDAFTQRRGYWNGDWERLLQSNPEYVATYLELSAYAGERGTLSPKTRELIYVATNCSPTHYLERGVRQHARLARQFGASLEELIAVAMVVSTVGVQTYLLGAAILEQIVPGAVLAQQDDAHRQAVHAKHLRLFAAALPEVEAAIRVDPKFYDVWLNFAAAAIGEGSPLSRKDSHLVALAAYGQCTQLCGPGVQQHMRAALASGATPNEIIDVCKLITSMSVHAVALPVPVLIDEWQKQS